jgi:glycosyltransferase involved in cell wall biosynthesis
MNILLIHTADYLHHPQPSRQHNIFEILAERHFVHTLHFHLESKGMTERKTKLIVHEATMFATNNPTLHYTLNAPYHYWMIRKILDENKIDVVVTSNVLASTAAILAARSKKIPVIFDLSDWLPDSAAAYVSNKYLKEIVRWTVFQIMQWNLKHSTATTTVSQSLKKRMGSAKGNPIVIMNGVDTRVFHPVSKRQCKQAIAAFYDARLMDAFIIGFAGALEEWYDIESMIKAMPDLLDKYPDTRMLIVGGSLFTDQANQLRALTLSMGLENKVIFTGFIAYDNLPAYIGAMDLCAIPLIPSEWAEIALPNKFFEYSAMNKPILMTPIHDVIEIGRDLFIYRNKGEYIKCIEHFRNINYEENTKPSFAGYDWKSRAEQFETIMHEVIRK